MVIPPTDDNRDWKRKLMVAKRPKVGLSVNVQ